MQHARSVACGLCPSEKSHLELVELREYMRVMGRLAEPGTDRRERIRQDSLRRIRSLGVQRVERSIGRVIESVYWSAEIQERALKGRTLSPNPAPGVRGANLCRPVTGHHFAHPIAAKAPMPERGHRGERATGARLRDVLDGQGAARRVCWLSARIHQHATPPSPKSCRATRRVVRSGRRVGGHIAERELLRSNVASNAARRCA